ncbi:MAG: helix-turn-helix domain-containing protein [Clostridia bacterium]|nr:helix-turn-helix domain-containing protein [Clostridia bacterium]
MIVSFHIIGRNIRSARRAAHLTQEQAAEKTGISALHFGRIERGEHEPSIRLLSRIASALDTSIFALLCGCILDKENHPVLFESPDPAAREYGEYVLVLLDAYQEQIRKTYEALKARERGNP